MQKHNIKNVNSDPRESVLFSSDLRKSVHMKISTFILISMDTWMSAFTI